jgi:zinc protease
MITTRTCLVLLAATVAAFGACIVRPTAEAPGAWVIDYATRQLVLPSGLHVVLERAPDFDVGGAVLMVGAGSADEPAGKEGLAHLTEHLAAEAKHGGLSIFEKFKDVGNSANATTSWDETTYYLFDTTDSLEQVVFYLHGVLQDPLAGVDACMFQRELQVVGHERRLSRDTGTDGEALEWLAPSVFSHGHPYAHPIVGTQASLAQLTFDDVRRFAADHYQAQARTLVVTAPLSLDVQQGLVERAFGGPAKIMTTSSSQRKHESAPSPQSPPRSFQTHSAEVPTPTLWIGWSVPSMSDSGGDLAAMLATTVENSLAVDLSRRDPDIAAVSAGWDFGTKAGMFFVRVALKLGKHPEQTARYVIAELEGGLGRLTSLGFSSATLKREAGVHYAYLDEHVIGRALNLARSQRTMGDPFYLRGLGERIVDLSAIDVEEYARRFLSEQRAHIVLVKPGADEAWDLSPVAANTCAQATPASSDDAMRFAVGPTVAAKQENRPPRMFAQTKSEFLPNGIRVFVLPRPGSPFHTVLLGFKGGAAEATPPGVATAAAWARQMQDSDTEEWGRPHHWETHSGSTFDVVRSTGTDVRVTLQQLRRALDYSLFWPPRHFAERLDVMKQADQLPAAVLERSMRRALLGQLASGLVFTSQDMRKIAPRDVQHWVDLVRRPDQAALVIVGNVDTDDALAVARAEFGAWGRKAASARDIEDLSVVEEVALGQRGRLFLQDRPGSQQASLHFACLLPAQTSENIADEKVFSSVVQKRLLEDLREGMAAAYHVTSQVSDLPGGTAVMDVSADVGYSQLSQALRLLRVQLTRPDGALAKAALFKRAQRSVARNLRLDAWTTSGLAAAIFDAWVRGWQVETLDQLPAKALASEATTVEEIARHCRENWVLGLLGDQQRTRAAWEESGQP